MKNGNGSVRAYDATAMALHWAMAAGIAFQLIAGFLMSRTDALPDTLRFAAFQWHKTVGLLVLALTLARIAWRIANPPPSGPPSSRAERAAAAATHAALYALMLAVPLSGWVLVSVSPSAIPTLLLTLESLPFAHLPLPRGEDAARPASSAHAWLAWSFAALLVLHVAAALKHSFLDRVPSLSRIVPTGRLERQAPRPGGAAPAVLLACALVVGGLAAGREPAPESDTPQETAVASASGWTIDKDASSMEWSATFSGKPIGGKVATWDASVAFDPDDLANASSTVTVAAPSVTVDDAFVRSSIAGPDGLDASANPTAGATFTDFSETGEGSYLAKGTLRVAGREIPAEMPFTFEQGDDGAVSVSGRLAFDRTALKLGVGNDPEGKWLSREVVVSVDLVARPSH